MGRATLLDDSAAETLAAAGPSFRLPAELGARTLYELTAGHRALAAKDAAGAAWLVDRLVPLDLRRTASFVLETRDLSTLEAEAPVEAQAGTFEAAKPHLRERRQALGLGR